MRRVLGGVIIGVVAVIIESSLLSLPILLLLSWMWSDSFEKRHLIWLMVGLGVLLDILTMRMVGMSAVMLMVFLLGLSLLRRFFAGNWLFEVGFGVVMIVFWQWLVTGRVGVIIFIFAVAAAGVVEMRKRFGLAGEIRLR